MWVVELNSSDRMASHDLDIIIMILHNSESKLTYTMHARVLVLLAGV